MLRWKWHHQSWKRCSTVWSNKKMVSHLQILLLFYFQLVVSFWMKTIFLIYTGKANALASFFPSNQVKTILSMLNLISVGWLFTQFSCWISGSSWLFYSKTALFQDFMQAHLCLNWPDPRFVSCLGYLNYTICHIIFL